MVYKFVGKWVCRQEAFNSANQLIKTFAAVRSTDNVAIKTQVVNRRLGFDFV